MRAGVGPADELQALGVEPAWDLPGVGRNLHDHPAVAVFHGGGQAGYGLAPSALPEIAAAPFQYLFQRRGLFVSNTVEAGGFARATRALYARDVQFHFIPARLGRGKRRIIWGRGYYCNVCVLKPTSRSA